MTPKTKLSKVGRERLEKKMPVDELIKRARELADHRFDTVHSVSASRAMYLKKMADALAVSGAAIEACRMFKATCDRMYHSPATHFNFGESYKAAANVVHELDAPSDGSEPTVSPMTDRESRLLRALKKMKAEFDPEDETPMRFEQVRALEWADDLIRSIEKELVTK